MRQRDAFLNGHGDLWLERNRKDLGGPDEVLGAMSALLAKITGPVLEIGCSNGWRLKNIKEKYGCPVWGLDPSALAASEGPEDFPIIKGTADSLPFADGMFAVVILGYFLFVTDPSDWFKIAHETTRVLQNSGLLVIYDHSCPRLTKLVYPYEDYEGKSLQMYWQDWPQFFLAHPGLKIMREDLTPTHASIAILHKDFNI